MSKLIDKSEWGEGPWQDEPDELNYEERGFRCLLIRSVFGAWVAYVEIPKDHPWYMNEDTPIYSIDVHGGVSYYGNNYHDTPWLIGFDCNHFTDYMPGRETEMRRDPELYRMHKKIESFRRKAFSNPEALQRTYKDIEFVKEQISHMIDQLLEVYEKKENNRVS